MASRMELRQQASAKRTLENIKSENKILLSLKNKAQANQAKIDAISVKIDLLRDQIDELIQINTGYAFDEDIIMKNIDAFAQAYATAMGMTKEEALVVALGDDAPVAQPEVDEVKCYVNEYTSEEAPAHIYPEHCFQPSTNEVDLVVGRAEDDEID